MSMPQMPNIPGAAVMTDTLDFVKNLWGSMGAVPGIAAPTLSVDELDKKINDLKAVESWLNLNSSMVRGSIQALEVQRNTIATLKSMGKTLADAVQQPGAAKEKSLFESIPYASAFFQHAAEALQPAAAGPAPKTPSWPPSAPAAAEPAAAPFAPSFTSSPAPSAAPPAAAAKAAAEPQAGGNAGTAGAGAAAGTDSAAAAAAPMANAAAWWNLLQDQFKQAVNTAMTTDVVSGAAARATEAASKFAAAAGKPLAKADKDNLPVAEDKPATARKAAANGATAARKAPAKRTKAS